MKSFRHILLVAASLLCLAPACQKPGSEEEYTAVITVNKSSIEFDATGDKTQTYLKVKSDHKWTAETTEGWLSVSEKSGAAGVEKLIVVKATDNEEKSPRHAEVIIKSGVSSVKVSVDQAKGVEILDPSQVPNYSSIYIPQEYRSHSFMRADRPWFFGRSVQSEHFIVFWEDGYGDQTPTHVTDKRFHVDLDELIDWAEQCYDCYCNTLHFADLGQGKSNLDKYKFLIFLEHTTTWAAYGFGYDNVVGCLWVNPDAANDKSTVAHEIGHSFQYQVYCDQLLNKEVKDNNSSGFRYDQGMGCDFWEQTAQWQAYIMCPKEVFTNYNFASYEDGGSEGFTNNCHRHFAHEQMRYASYFFHYYWAEKYGIDAVAKVWRSARKPDDSLQAYMNCFGLSIEEFNDQLYEYAAKCATWDIDRLRDYGKSKRLKISWSGILDEDGYYKVSPKKVPEATGFNLIRLKFADPGSEVTVSFEGLPDEPGYNGCGNPDIAGWTVGFVCMSDDGVTRYYSPSQVADASNGNKVTSTWTVPEDCGYIWYVVACTPKQYITHLWDDDNSNDIQWPYRIKIEGAKL